MSAHVIANHFFVSMVMLMVVSTVHLENNHVEFMSVFFNVEFKDILAFIEVEDLNARFCRTVGCWSW